jgi:hypothetical protein
LRPRTKIEEGAQTLVGISNQMVTANKDLPHLTELIKKLVGALDIGVYPMESAIHVYEVRAKIIAVCVVF